MKKTIIALLASAALFSAQAATNSIVLSWDTSHYSSQSGGDGGGAFAAQTTDNFVANYAPSAIYNGSFLTYCVEPDVFFYPNQSYSYSLSQIASDGKSLTLGTAWLYQQFATGAIQVNNTTQAGQIQTAFWLLQGETPPAGWTYTGDVYVDLVQSALGNNITDPSDGAYGVSIINMFDANGQPAQNQLVYVPHSAVPEPSTIAAGALLLLPFGWSVARTLRREKVV